MSKTENMGFSSLERNNAGNCGAEISGAFNLPGAGQPQLQFTPAVYNNCRLEDSSFEYKHPQAETSLSLGRKGPGHIRNLNYGLNLETGSKKVRIIGQATAILDGEKFKKAFFELLVTDIPSPQEPETAKVTIICDDKTYKSGLLKRVGRGVIISGCS